MGGEDGDEWTKAVLSRKGEQDQQDLVRLWSWVPWQAELVVVFPPSRPRLEAVMVVGSLDI